MNKRPTKIKADDDDDLYDDDPEEFQESEGKQRVSANPIVAAVQSALARRGYQVSTLRGQPPNDEDAEIFFDNVFGTDVQKELGKMLLVALMDQDKTFPKVVARAIKQIDPVFNRHLEIAMAERVKKYVWSLPEPLPDSQTLKAAVEEHCNNGKTLEPYQWQRLQRVCLIPRQTGRPAKANTKPSKSL